VPSSLKEQPDCPTEMEPSTFIQVPLFGPVLSATHWYPPVGQLPVRFSLPGLARMHACPTWLCGGGSTGCEPTGVLESVIQLPVEELQQPFITFPLTFSVGRRMHDVPGYLVQSTVAVHVNSNVIGFGFGKLAQSHWPPLRVLN
jgi:hypothetical protein